MNGIRPFPYRLLWVERQILSITNLNRWAVLEFFAVVAA
jgi:hypothetical protein